VLPYPSVAMPVLSSMGWCDQLMNLHAMHFSPSITPRVIHTNILTSVLKHAEYFLAPEPGTKFHSSIEPYKSAALSSLWYINLQGWLMLACCRFIKWF